jgi:hypothetical protein
MCRCRVVSCQGDMELLKIQLKEKGERSQKQGTILYKAFEFEAMIG